MPTDQSRYRLEQLSPEQRARCAALHEARAVIVQRAVLSSGSANTVDLITVAQWILDGKDPWPIDAESDVDAKSNPDEDSLTGKLTGDSSGEEDEVKPSIGRIMHHVSYGTWHWPERVE